MPRFFCDNIADGFIEIIGDDAKHISRSLRMKKGETIEICDAKGTDYLCELISFTDTVRCRIISSKTTEAEPDIKVILYQALPKSDKMDLIVQKCVELGVTEIVPVMTKRCVSRHDAESFSKKQERYSKIAAEAAKQSGRGIIPNVAQLCTFDEAVKAMQENDISFICYEGGGNRLTSELLSQKKTIGIFIGGEGGFEPQEVLECEKHGIVRIGLGPRILRCETAPIATISIIMSLTENM